MAEKAKYIDVKELSIKGIENAYEKAAAQDFFLYGKETLEFERLVAELPPRSWIE